MVDTVHHTIFTCKIHRPSWYDYTVLVRMAVLFVFAHEPPSSMTEPLHLDYGRPAHTVVLERVRKYL
jgi:hypothetical protein